MTRGRKKTGVPQGYTLRAIAERFGGRPYWDLVE